MDPDQAALLQVLSAVLIIVSAIGIVRAIATALEEHFHDDDA